MRVGAFVGAAACECARARMCMHVRARVCSCHSACVRRYASLRLVLTVHNVDQFDLRATVVLAQSSRLFVVRAPLRQYAVRLSAGSGG